MQASTEVSVATTYTPKNELSLTGTKNSYGPLTIAGNARVHLGDVHTHVNHLGEQLPEQGLLDQFISDYIDLVERFDLRMTTLKSSLDQDAAVKSQAIRNIGREVSDLQDQMSRNKNSLLRAKELNDSATESKREAYLRILIFMNKTLQDILDSMAASLQNQNRTETNRLEQERLLREIDESRQNLSDSIGSVCDGLQVAGKAIQLIPQEKQRPELRKVGQVVDNGAFVTGLFNKFANFARKNKKEPERNVNGYETAADQNRSHHMRRDGENGLAWESRYGSNRSARGPPSGGPTYGHNSTFSNRDRLTGDTGGWELRPLEQPPQRIARTGHQERTPPPLPARAPPLPPRPRRVTTEPISLFSSGSASCSAFPVKNITIPTIGSPSVDGSVDAPQQNCTQIAIAKILVDDAAGCKKKPAIPKKPKRLCSAPVTLLDLQ